VRPSYQKVNPADQPIIYYAMSSSTLSLPELDDYAETFIAQRLSTVSGVAQVNVYGAAKYAVRIQLDPKALATRAIGIDEVAAGVAAGNVNLPTGILWGPHRAYTVQANGQLQSAAEFGPLIVTYRTARRCGCRTWGACWTTCRTTRAPPGTTAVAQSSSPSSGSRARTRWRSRAGCVRSWRPLKQLLPASVDFAAPLRPLGVDSRLAHGRQVHIVLTLALVVLVIFLFPPQPVGDDHPSLACRSRSWARSPSCTPSTTASTTSR